MFFLDKIFFIRKTTDRQFSMKGGWTKQKMKERMQAKKEAHGFGKGSIEPSLELPKIEDQHLYLR